MVATQKQNVRYVHVLVIIGLELGYQVNVQILNQIPPDTLYNAFFGVRGERLKHVKKYI